MISRVPQKVSAWLTVSSIVAVTGLPPKNPHDNDEDEEDEEDDNEEEEEPAVIREPDEC